MCKEWAGKIDVFEDHSKWNMAEVVTRVLCKWYSKQITLHGIRKFMLKEQWEICLLWWAVLNNFGKSFEYKPGEFKL